MDKKIVLSGGAFLFVLISFFGDMHGYTITIHNRDWRDHKLKLDHVAIGDNHPFIKAGGTVKVNVGAKCTRGVEIETPESRKGTKKDNPGGNCRSLTVWITRDSDKNKYLDVR